MGGKGPVNLTWVQQLLNLLTSCSFKYLLPIPQDYLGQWAANKCLLFKNIVVMAHLCLADPLALLFKHRWDN